MPDDPMVLQGVLALGNRATSTIKPGQATLSHFVLKIYVPSKYKLIDTDMSFQYMKCNKLCYAIYFSFLSVAMFIA